MLRTMGAAAIVAATTGGALSFAPAGETLQEKADSIAEIMRYVIAMSPFKRIWFQRQARLLIAGEPNAITGNGDFTYEEYLDGFSPDCVNWINAGCPEGWRGPDKIRAERLARRRERRRQQMALTA